MEFNIKKSFDILLKNPHVMLLFVTYLLILASMFPLLLYTVKTSYFYIIVLLMFLLTCAFFSGWFGMIKCIVEYKGSDDPVEEMKLRYYSFKDAFFSSVANYILPIIFYILLCLGVIYLTGRAADMLFGKPVDILNQMAPYKGNPDALYNFVATIPKDVLKVIVERNMFRYLSFLFYIFLTFYSIPALYFNKTPNPFKGLITGLCAIFKKPFATVLFFLSVVFIHIFLVFFEAVSVINQFLMFIALVLRVTFFAFIVVLIFSVYEKNFTCNNNGADSVGENKSGN